MRPGDDVVITIPKENREWGYNPCADGTIGKILGFSEISYGRIGNFGNKPGVYVNRCWVKLRLQNGNEHTEYSGRLELVDKVEYARRLAELHQFQAANPGEPPKSEFLRDLPESQFWEGDLVRVHNRLGIPISLVGSSPDSDPNIFMVVSVDYDRISEEAKMIGRSYQAYDISPKAGAGWRISVSKEELTLVERGRVWKHYNNEPISFSDIKEEASFFDSLGHTDEVRNPVNSLYCWTKEQVLDAIREGTVHGFSVASGFFGAAPSIRAIRFRNEDLGRRVAKATLEGFKITPS